MRIPWTRFGLVGASCLWAVSAGAQYINGAAVDLTNHTTRQIILRGEDTTIHTATQSQGCVNPGATPLGSKQTSVGSDPTCFRGAGDPLSVYFLNSNDLFGTLSFIGSSTATGGTNTFEIAIDQTTWGQGVAYTLSQDVSGSSLSTNTDFETLFDATNGKVVPNPASGAAPNYWNATATVFNGAIHITLDGIPDPLDFAFYGTPVNPTYSSTATSPPGTYQYYPPLVFSCQWAGANDPTGTSTLYGPGYPGTGVCGTGTSLYKAQQGFQNVTSPPFTGPGVTFYMTSPVFIASSTTAATDAAFTSIAWQLQEKIAGTSSCFGGLMPGCKDHDGDSVADDLDNCPFAANPPVAPAIVQTDSGGLNTTSQDGIGDACQCGDIDGNGIVNSTDGLRYNRAALGLSTYFSIASNADCQAAGDPAACCSGLGTGSCGSPGMPGAAPPEKCNVNNSPGVCNSSQALFVIRSTLGLSPGIKNGCRAAVCHAPETCP